MRSPLKYIELLSIEQVDDQYYLQIVLHSDISETVLWRIDEITYENLYLHCNFDSNYKYRLSFKVSDNSLLNYMVGRITKTHLNNSTMIDFKTTATFKEQLGLIRQAANNDQIDRLPFLMKTNNTLHEIDSTTENPVIEAKNETNLQTNNINGDGNADSADPMINQSEQVTIDDSLENQIESYITEQQLDETVNNTQVEKADDIEPKEEHKSIDSQNISTEAGDSNIDSLDSHSENKDIENTDDNNIEEHSPLLKGDSDEEKTISINNETDKHSSDKEETSTELASSTEMESIDKPSEEQKSSNEELNALSNDENPLITNNGDDELLNNTSEQYENGATQTEDNEKEDEKVTPIQNEVEHESTISMIQSNQDAIDNNEEKSEEQQFQKTVKTEIKLTPKKISLIVLVTVLFAVMLYFLVFKQAAQVKDTVAQANANSDTYIVEEAYTFSLPKQYVALTFNRGPSKYTESILNILQQHKIGATFFLQGSHIQSYPEIVKQIQANGHSIGHITEKFSLLTMMELQEQQIEWSKPKQSIENITGEQVTLFRPPYGIFNEHTIALQEEHQFKIISSTITPKSSDKSKDIIEEITNTNLAGAIIALDETKTTIESLPSIIEYIQQSNLHIVTLK